MINLYNCDNMEFMKNVPDKFYDLAIVDPPYGIDADKKNSTKIQYKKSVAMRKFYGNQEWDSDIPSEEYFTELFRVSKKQVIWGANYFGLVGGYLFWNKNVAMDTYSKGELAWLSWLNKLDYLELTWNGMLQYDMSNKEHRIHPTQKPVQLYKWLLKNYAKEGDKILDTHGGSMSIALACHDLDFDLDLCELDKDYFDAGVKRFEQHKKQLKLL